ncbi:hypothetical protein [Aureimonas populi]|uniref:DUF551 domain-containing protein n=1 Tax=Aureimonas populi TaxID=1701758 RepID=A0ABW5CI83_9HYPH|nr:hypothetical protein [Aureimonas populi]
MTPPETFQWRDLASAPRDGTRILVTLRATEQGPATVDTAYWARGTSRAGEGWRAADSSADCVILYAEAELMGWMPLPSPLAASWPEPMRPEDAQEDAGSGI